MQNDFGPWNYRGYAIERYLPEDGPVEFIVVSKSNLSFPKLLNMMHHRLKPSAIDTN